MRRFAFVVVGAGSLALAGQALAAETASDGLTVTAVTQEAISVACGQNLSFGTLAVKSSGGSEAKVTVGAISGGTASSSNTSVYVVDSGQSGVCTVSGEDGSDGTATLVSGTATFTGTTLSGVSLEDTSIATGTLSADIELSKATAVADGDLYIGGTLTVPANHAVYATYEATVTLTVTD